MKKLPSKAYLDSRLIYSAESGELRWRATFDKLGRPNTKLVHRIAGNIQSDGYRYVYIDGENYSAHRVIWKIMTGNDPEREIDHKNNTRDDNRWCNLREASHAFNNHNVGCKRHSKSGIKGVRQVKSRWAAMITHNYKFIHLGTFDSPEDAAAAYKDAAIKIYGNEARVA